MRVGEISIESESAAKLRDGFIVATPHHQGAPEVGVDDEREWIEFNGAFSLLDPFIKAALRDQKTVSKPMVSGRVVRVDLNGAPELLFGFR